MMQRLVLVIGLVMTTLAASADEPSTTQVADKPPYERLLRGADAKKATDLTKRIGEQSATDNYATAIEAAQELMTLRVKSQGADHWEAVNARWQITALEKVAALPAEKRAGWRKSAEATVTADDLEKKTKYTEALLLRQTRLKGCQDGLGEEHPDTAQSYNYLAIDLYHLRRYTDAGPLFQKALDIRRALLGENHPDTAQSYNNLANHLNNQAKYAEARSLYQKALDLRRSVLGDDHLDTAQSYNNLAQNLHSQGKYADALPLFQKALDIRRRLFGEEHPDTATSYNNLAENLGSQGKYANAILLHQNALGIRRRLLGEEHLDTAESYNNLAANLNSQGKYAEALPILQRALDIKRRIHGEEHPAIALGYNNLAANLNSQGKYAEALLFYQKALEICRSVYGEEHANTCHCYNNLAFNLYSQGKYADAQPLFQTTLDIRRRVLSDDHPDTAGSYSNVAGNLAAQGKYADASPLFEKALVIRRRILGEDHPETAVSYGSVAFNLHHQGKDADAQLLYQKALDISRRTLGEEHPQTANAYNNVAATLEDQGKPADAQSLYQKALDIKRRIHGDDHPQTANAYNSLAKNLNAQGKHSDALPLCRKALDIARRTLGDDHPQTANAYNGIAYNLYVQGKYADAQVACQKALDIRRALLGENHPDTLISYINLAVNLTAQGRYADAHVLLAKATPSYEAARLKVADWGRERAVFGASRSPYRLCAVLHARLAAPVAAWEAVEADLARGLADEAATRRGTLLTPVEMTRRNDLLSQLATAQARILALLTRTARAPAEDRELDGLRSDRVAAEGDLADLAAAVSRREVASLSDVQEALSADTALILWVDETDKSGAVREFWGCVVRTKGNPAWEPLAGSGADRAWTAQDTELPTVFRSALAGASPAVEVEALAKRLHFQRLVPLEKHLVGIKHLIVVPVGCMVGVSVEAITDRYSISYIPSGTSLARLKRRPQPAGDAVLALGDPAFGTPPVLVDAPLPPSGLLVTHVVPGGAAAKVRVQPGDVLLAYAGTNLTSADQLQKLTAAHTGDKTVAVMVWREGEAKHTVKDFPGGRLGVVLAREPAPQAITVKRKTDRMLAAVARGGDWAALPGTRTEVATLERLFGERVTTLTGSVASEQRLEELRTAGALKTFKYLHFGTHGEANYAKAFESALILARDQLPKGLPCAGEKSFDGRLTASEILEGWDLDADLVTLSACETGMGLSRGGDGVLGFAQAFLHAGSRAVCLSLWKVDDSATALLMDRFYRNLAGKRPGLEKPLGKSAALQEAKEWLRSLNAEEVGKLLGDLTNGVPRGAGQPALKLTGPATNSEKGDRPFAHPRYWAAFVLIGDPN